MLKSVVAGFDELAPGHLPRHRHLEPYAIAVLRGCFDQVSYAGRVRVRAGQLLVQPRLDCHANRLVSRGARILRLPWPDEPGLGGVYDVDLDAVARTAERDLGEAVQLALAQRVASRVRGRDWPDVLAEALVAGEVRLADWADLHGISRETLSRGFAAAYGVPAHRFRLELRAREAWLRIVAAARRSRRSPLRPASPTSRT